MPSLLDAATAALLKALEADYEGSGLLTNPGLKGRAREQALLGRIIDAYLPRNLKVAQGAEIVDSKGGNSGECDLVLYDPMVPPINRVGETLQLASESVFGLVEAKSRLTLAELRSAYKKILRVKKLDRSAYVGAPNQVNCISYERTWPACPLHGFIIAFQSVDLTKLRRELDRLHLGSDYDKRVDSVWVVNQGYIVNWLEGGQTIDPLPDSRTRLWSGRTSNPLPLLIRQFHELYGEHVPFPVRLEAYGLSDLSPDEWLD